MFIRSTFLSALRVARSGSLVIQMMSQKPTVVFVLGGPGAGKGTQCSLIVQVCQLIVVHFSRCSYQ